ncbi:MAG: DUF4367 domain-containing protein [Clostridia bacterium]|nr:DUF4367 domain-containing protein [Clostridia bacterium]
MSPFTGLKGIYLTRGGKQMSDNKRGERSFGMLDNITTAELEDLMRQMPLEDMDTDYWNAVMDAYMSRADAPKSDVEAALNDFKERYSGNEPIFCDDYENPKGIQTSHRVVKTNHRRLSRTGLVAAIVAVMLIAGTVTAYAFGYDLWGAVATWTKETFSFIVADNEPTPIISPDSELYELHLAIFDANITQEVAPTWLPEGYEVKSLNVSSEPFKLFAAYSKDDENILIQMSVIDPLNSMIFEKDVGDVEEYVVSGITHYIISNNNQLQAVWVNANLECSISGDISNSEMQQIIQSIYKES